MFELCHGPPAGGGGGPGVEVVVGLKATGSPVGETLEHRSFIPHGPRRQCRVGEPGEDLDGLDWRLWTRWAAPQEAEDHQPGLHLGSRRTFIAVVLVGASRWSC